VVEEGRKKVKMKVAVIRANIHEKREAGYVKYYKSDAGFKLHEALIEPTRMPKVVISFSLRTIEELADLYEKADGGDKWAEAKLRVHPAKIEYLSQIRVGLEAQLTQIEHELEMEGRDSRYGGEFMEAERRVRQVLTYIAGLIVEIEQDYSMSNEWLRETYEAEFGKYVGKVSA